MKKWMYNCLLILFSCAFLVSLFFLGKYFWEGHVQESLVDDLSALRDETAPRPVIGEDGAVENTDETPTLVQVTDPKTGETRMILPEFVQLYTRNSDIVGWIEIPGTKINYPVMQSPDNRDFYLSHNFDKEYSGRGCIYANEDCDIFAPSDNITMYGHWMGDGTMFAQLHKYKSQDFYKEHAYIYFDTLEALHTYQILAVFTTTASVGEGFVYHSFIDAADEIAFNEFVSSCKALSLYDTGVDAAYGDKLICLSTCEYSQTNGRLVIVAKQIA